MTTRAINPDLVTLAREYRDLTQEELARALEVTQGKVAKIEGGLQTEVAEEMLGRLSSVLQFPREFFFQDWSRLGFGSSAFYYRKRARIAASDRKSISSVVNLHLMCIKKYLDAVDVQSARLLPQLELDSFGRSPATVARAVRAAWNLPVGPVKNLTALLESAGILVIPCSFGGSVDATSLRLSSFPPIVFIDANVPGDRWRFTLAHELAHLVMHPTPSETMEEEADEFAAEFLMPEDDILPALKSLGTLRIPHLITLKSFWKTSMAALLMRAGHLGLLTENQKRHLWAQLAKNGYLKSEPEPIAREGLQNHSKLLNYYLDGLRWSVDELAKLSALSRDVFMSLHELSLPNIKGPVLRLVK